MSYRIIERVKRFKVSVSHTVFTEWVVRARDAEHAEEVWWTLADDQRKLIVEDTSHSEIDKVEELT